MWFPEGRAAERISPRLCVCTPGSQTGGIPPERIWQEERASSTQENLRFSLELIQEKTGSRPQELAVVSSEYHLYRASCMAKEEGWNAWASPAATYPLVLRLHYGFREIFAFGISCCLADHNMEGEHDMDKQYASYAAQQAAALLGGRQPHRLYNRAAAWVLEAFRGLGFEARLTTKGGVLIDLGGQNVDDALLLEAHTDTLGAMVAEVKSSGRLRLTPLGA